MAVVNLFLTFGANIDIKDMSGITARQRIRQREAELCAPVVD